MSNMYGYYDYHGPSFWTHLSGTDDSCCGAEETPTTPCLAQAISNLANDRCSQSPNTTPIDKDDLTVTTDDDNIDNDNDTDWVHNPLQAGFWMEGDSLAPPCGTSIPALHAILELCHLSESPLPSSMSSSSSSLSKTSATSIVGELVHNRHQQRQKVLYDLGCGDGRVCLEAFARYQCQTVGVEIERDLVDRAHYLLNQLPKTWRNHSRVPLILNQDLRCVLDQLIHQVSCPDDSSHPMTQLQGSNEKHSIQEEHSKLPLPTTVMLYLLPEALAEIEFQLLMLLDRLPEDFLIVCNSWGLPSIEPIQCAEVQERKGGSTTRVFIYDRNSPLKTVHR